MALENYQEEWGVDPYRRLIEIAAEPGGAKDAIAAWKIILDTLTKGESEQEVEVTKREVGPTVFLPEEAPRGEPVKLISREPAQH